jgi:hypothetical protein
MYVAPLDSISTVSLFILLGVARRAAFDSAYFSTNSVLVQTVSATPRTALVSACAPVARDGATRSVVVLCVGTQ